MKPLSEAIGGYKRIIGGPFGSKLTSKDYTEAGVPIIRGSNMEADGRWIGGDFSYVSAEKYARDLSTNTARRGDIIVTQRGTLGQVAIVKDDAPEEYFVVSQSQMAISVNDKSADRDFIYYYLKSPQFSEYSNSQTIQTGVPHINLGILRDAPTDFPCLSEQREIAAILGALDDKIEVNRKAAATLEAMARALYRSWFVDFDPVHAKAEGRQPAHMDAATAALFPDRFGDNGLPLGWEMKQLGNILKLNYGKALKKELRVAGEYPVYGSGGTDSTHNQALISEPTIIVGRKGTVGSLYWEPNGCWPIDTVFYVTTSYPLPFIYRTLQEQPLAEMNTDAAVPGLNRDNAYRLEIAMSDDIVLAAFNAQIALWQSRIDRVVSENRTLANLRDSLLPRLMSGELRVGAAEKIVSEAV